MQITYDNHKLIDFGWSFEEYAYEQNYTIYDEMGTTYSRIIELDENDNVVFNAILQESSYRVFKNKFYNGETKNYEVSEYKLIDTTPFTILEEVNTKTIEENLENASISPFEVEITKNSVDMNVAFDILEDVKIVFVKDNGKSYFLNYKSTNSDALSKVNLDVSGTYAIYMKVDDKWYNLEKSINFGD